MITHCRLEEIKVGPRFRKRLGNVEALARSIEEVQLLHAIVIDQNSNLVAGQRRLEALKLLIARGAEGWKEVPVRQVNLDDLLAAEHDENVHRLDYAPSEAVAIAEALEGRLKEHARARQLAGLRGGPVPPNWRDEESGETRERLAACVRMGRTSLTKARKVVEAARRDPERYGDLVERMDDTRLVDPAYKELERRAKGAVAERQQALAYSQPGPDDPYPGLEHRAYRDIRVCSATELLASLDHRVDAIVTEPPAFDRGRRAAADLEMIRQGYEDLARLSGTALKPGGVLAVISRNPDIADVIAAVAPHLTYMMTIAVLTAAKEPTWRPVIVFGRVPRMLCDMIKREPDDDSNGIADLIRILTKPLDLVADPFMGDSAGIVKIGRTWFHPVRDACSHLGRSFVGADQDGIFQGGFGEIDFDRLRGMVEDLRAAEPKWRHLITDEYGKVTNVLVEPSTYPDWLGTSKGRRTRVHADRIIRLVEAVLGGGVMVGNGPCPPGTVRISREDQTLLDEVLDMVSSGPLDEVDLAELLRDEWLFPADDETPDENEAPAEPGETTTAEAAPAPPERIDELAAHTDIEVSDAGERDQLREPIAFGWQQGIDPYASEEVTPVLSTTKVPAVLTDGGETEERDGPPLAQ